MWLSCYGQHILLIFIMEHNIPYLPLTAYLFSRMVLLKNGADIYMVAELILTYG